MSKMPTNKPYLSLRMNLSIISLYILMKIFLSPTFQSQSFISLYATLVESLENVMNRILFSDFFLLSDSMGYKGLLIIRIKTRQQIFQLQYVVSENFLWFVKTNPWRLNFWH